MTGNLSASVRLNRGSFTLAVDLDVARGEVVAILGPNGAGKSTLLDCIAGLTPADTCSVRLAGRPLDGARPHERRIGLLSQDPLLFPHLTALDNVAFGRRARGQGRARARADAAAWLAEVAAADLAGRKPAQLSGGQAQRVAVARVLASEPDLVLLDEPLAAMDVDAAPAMRGLLRRVLRTGDRPALLVTHDPMDALALADIVLVLDDGHVVERGPTQVVLRAPRTPFTARIAGVNLVAGVAVPDGLRTSDGVHLTGLHSRDAVLSEPAVAVFAPTAVSVFPAADGAGHGSPRNTARVAVASVEPHGPVVRLRTADTGSWAAGIFVDLTPAAVAELGIGPGDDVELAVKATAVEVHPAVSQCGLRGDG